MDTLVGGLDEVALALPQQRQFDSFVPTRARCGPRLTRCLPALAGEGASNVIPECVRMTGTIRALTKTHFERLRRRVAEVGA